MLAVACEVLLCGACLYAAGDCVRRRQGWAVLAFVLLGLAAALGALLYAGLAGLAGLHEWFSTGAGRLFLPLLATAGGASRGRLLGVLAALAFMSVAPPQLLLAGNLLALLVIAWKGRSRHGARALTGAVLFAGTGLLVGSRGEWLGIPRLDLFHLGLAWAVAVWGCAGIGAPAATSAALPAAPRAP